MSFFKEYAEIEFFDGTKIIIELRPTDAKEWTKGIDLKDGKRCDFNHRYIKLIRRNIDKPVDKLVM